MKTFKEHITEAFSSGGVPVMQQQWQDQDVIPSAETAVEALNSYVGSIGEHEYMNPRLAVKKLQENLSRLGYEFDIPTIEGSSGGEYSLPLRYGNGTFRANYDENPYGEYQETDGISEHIQGGISLVVTVTPVGNGKSIVSPEILRNADVESTE